MATTKSREWKFEQLAQVPGKDKIDVSLSGALAPHGRPRKNPVVSDGIKLRQNSVYYPGNVPPTRHVFGSKWEDVKLNGRWMQRDVLSGTPAELVRIFQQLVMDGQPIRISWSDIISMTGYLSEFTPHRESPDEIAWEMTILVDDQDWQRQPSRIISDNISPSVLASKCYAELQTGLGILPKAAKKVQMNNDFLDAVDTLISSINTFSASFIHAANSIDSFETAVAGDIGRLRAGVHQLRTSVLTLRDTMARAKDDSLFIARTADTDINWFTIQLDTETSLLKAMSLMEELDKQAETAQRKSEFVPYTAKLGDSWESISNDFYGGPQGAAKIRSANGVKYGDLPHSGHSYVIPI